MIDIALDLVITSDLFVYVGALKLAFPKVGTPGIFDRKIQGDISLKSPIIR